MKKYVSLFFFLIWLAGCQALEDPIVEVEPLDPDEQAVVHIEGVVVHAEGNHIVLSRKDKFSSCDLLPDFDAYLEQSASYDLLMISDVMAPVGDIVRVEIEANVEAGEPDQAVGISLDVLSQLDTSQPCDPNEDPSPVVSTDLIHLFPDSIGSTQQFHGYAEYGHTLTLVNYETSDTTATLQFKGQMADGMGDGEDRVFDLTYQITPDAVIETIQNDDPFHRLEDSQLLNSIIPNRTILKQPLEVGHAWDETFTYLGETYTATTTITQVDSTESETTVYTTETIVSGISGYYKDCYKETRTFESGQGMTVFMNLLSKEAVGVSYPEDEETEDLYIFGYSLTPTE